MTSTCTGIQTRRALATHRAHVIACKLDKFNPSISYSIYTILRNNGPIGILCLFERLKSGENITKDYTSALCYISKIVIVPF